MGVEHMAEIKKTAPKKAKHVKMTRDGRDANVHPDEVANYKKGNWVESK
tara:strand:+ start:4719 stop:4865 length:147 start_codon:yes stop_codon:yes gene_type:complete